MKVNGKDYPIYEMEKTCLKPPTSINNTKYIYTKSAMQTMKQMSTKLYLNDLKCI
jgi:hypothetical protein